MFVLLLFSLKNHVSQKRLKNQMMVDQKEQQQLI